jgi:uracil-DNA glycosylase
MGMPHFKITGLEIQIVIHRDLSPVAKQGVLWLNTSLTVRAHKAGSHARKGWETFTTQVIRAVLQRKREGGKLGVVFMAWGLPAQKTFSSIGIDEVIVSRKVLNFI